MSSYGGESESTNGVGGATRVCGGMGDVVIAVPRCEVRRRSEIGDSSRLRPLTKCGPDAGACPGPCDGEDPS